MRRTFDLRSGRPVWMAYRAPSVPCTRLRRDARTGAFGTTRTGLPLIGKLPGNPRVHAVMGYGGNGITFSRIAAEIVLADLTGATDADAALFAFEA